MSGPKPIDPYRALALDAAGITFLRPIFTANPHIPTQLLLENVINYFVIFTGSFNPPHWGQEETIAHCFEDAPPGMHIVAGVIQFVNDEGVRHKVQGSSPIALPHSQRLQLIKIPQITSRCYCFPGTDTQFDVFLAALNDVMKNTHF
ncbi:hypothetical protein BDV96DRAFT_596611 [Lophiotrema nucula]|uniref:Uncharacterized protein n=1 Tax=Lophiotrema nucula TaxID=690887 RepID=A0A6A5ZH14_9PLEO|nr:hypothetical protein BDV96DRAFT_596611 [Lophiotrema nucula]